MTTGYSLRDVVPDGLLGPSPRWVLHLVKLAQHAAPAFALVVLWAAIGTPDYFLIGFASGLASYAWLVIRKRLRAGFDGPANRPDWLFDASFPMLITGGGALASHAWLEAAFLLALAVALYLGLHERGNP